MSRMEEIDACIAQVNYAPIPFVSTGGEDQPVFETIKNLGRVSIVVGSELADGAFPILRPRRITTPLLNPDGNPPPSRLGWQALQSGSRRVRTTLTVRTSFQIQFENTLSGVFSAFVPITSQTGRIHVIAGTPFEFRVRQINQETEGDGSPGSEYWNAEYTWIHDPGVLAPPTLPPGWQEQAGNAIGNDRIRMPYLESPFAPGYRFLIPPHAEPLYDELELPNGDLENPEFFARQIPAVDQEGFTVLPGLGGGG